jgi:hypothetical protein
MYPDFCNIPKIFFFEGSIINLAKLGFLMHNRTIKIEKKKQMFDKDNQCRLLSSLVWNIN